MEDGTPPPTEEWQIEDGAINRIESKLDALSADVKRLVEVLEKFEPLLNKYAEFQTMSAADKVKAMINRGKS